MCCRPRLPGACNTRARICRRPCLSCSVMKAVGRFLRHWRPCMKESSRHIFPPSGGAWSVYHTWFKAVKAVAYTDEELLESVPQPEAGTGVHPIGRKTLLAQASGKRERLRLSQLRPGAAGTSTRSWQRDFRRSGRTEAICFPNLGSHDCPSAAWPTE